MSQQNILILLVSVLLAVALVAGISLSDLLLLGSLASIMLYIFTDHRRQPGSGLRP